MIQLKNISVIFGRQELYSNASLNINNNEKLAIVGQNGSGKTSLIRCTTGEIKFDGEIKIDETISILEQESQFDMTTGSFDDYLISKKEKIQNQINDIEKSLMNEEIIKLKPKFLYILILNIFMSRDILVVERKKLFGNKEFQGFSPINMHDFSNVALSNFEYHERTDELENNADLKQIIPYVWIINPINKTVFLYKRSTDGGEGRLHKKFSGGVGGHIDRDTEEASVDPIIDAMMRELKEELTMENYPTPKFVGFLNDDSDPVGRVHFGVVAIAETEEEAIPAEGMTKGKFFTIEEAENLLNDPANDLESWSKHSWPYVKNYLKSI